VNISPTFSSVANGRLELLEPTQLHVQGVVQKLIPNKFVPLVEANVDRCCTTYGKIYAFGNVRAILQEGSKKREPKLLGCNHGKGRC
jgi:hypothetical protein